MIKIDQRLDIDMTQDADFIGDKICQVMNLTRSYNGRIKVNSNKTGVFIKGEIRAEEAWEFFFLLDRI